MTLLLQLLTNGVIRGGIYALVALSFALIYRGARAFHIAHGGIYTAGAYALYGFYNLIHLPFVISLFLSLLGVALLGLLAEKWIYSPLSARRASSAAIIISSLAIYIIIVNLIALFFGNETKIIFQGIGRSYSLAGMIVTRTQLAQLLASLFFVILIAVALNKTRLGLSIQALANNPPLAKALGFEIKRLRVVIFVTGSVLVGIAAILVSSDVGMDPWGGMSMFLAGAVAMIVGGIKRWEGAILGGFLLGIVQALAIWKFSARWQDVVTFILLIAFLLFRPQGILGKKLRMEEI